MGNRTAEQPSSHVAGRMKVMVVMAESIVVSAQDAASNLLEAPDGPYLRLDPLARLNLVGLGPKESTVRHAYAFGERLVITSDSTTWKTNPDLDIMARGWRSTIGASYDLGWARIDASATLAAIDSRYGAGSYRDYSLAVTKTKQLSRGRKAWVSLALGMREWKEAPPTGEDNAIQLGLLVGFTF